MSELQDLLARKEKLLWEVTTVKNRIDEINREAIAKRYEMRVHKNELKFRPRNAAILMAYESSSLTWAELGKRFALSPAGVKAACYREAACQYRDQHKQLRAHTPEAAAKLRIEARAPLDPPLRGKRTYKGPNNPFHLGG